MPSASVAAHLAVLMILITSGMASANLQFSASIESPDGPINTSQYPIDSNILYLLDIYNQPELDDSGITDSFDEEGIAVSLKFLPLTPALLSRISLHYESFRKN